MLRINEIQDIADEILAEALGEGEYDRVSVRSGLDHDDVPALFIEANLKKRTPVVSGVAYASALSALRKALLHRDEDRFPYLTFVHPEDRNASQRSEKPGRRKARYAHG